MSQMGPSFLPSKKILQLVTKIIINEYKRILLKYKMFNLVNVYITFHS